MGIGQVWCRKSGDMQRGVKSVSVSLLLYKTTITSSFNASLRTVPITWLTNGWFIPWPPPSLILYHIMISHIIYICTILVTKTTTFTVLTTLRILKIRKYYYYTMFKRTVILLNSNKFFSIRINCIKKKIYFYFFWAKNQLYQMKKLIKHQSSRQKYGR